MRFKKNDNNSYSVYSSGREGSSLLCQIFVSQSKTKPEEQFTFEWNTNDKNVQLEILQAWKSKRERIPFITILCEGKTELHYLTEIVKILGLTNSVSISSYNGGDPKIQFLPAVNNFLWQKHFKPELKQELWLVFDRDSHPGYKSLTEMPNVNSGGIYLAWSNPCIEYWFLLHFEKFLDSELPRSRKEEIGKKTWKEPGEERYVENVLSQVSYRTEVAPDDCLAKLKELSKGYSKNSANTYYRFASQLPFALKRCANTTNPTLHGSSIPVLIERLIKYSPYSRTNAIAMLSEAKASQEVKAQKDLDWTTTEFNRFKSLIGSLQTSETITNDNSKFVLKFLKKILVNVSKKTDQDIVRDYFPN